MLRDCSRDGINWRAGVLDLYGDGHLGESENAAPGRPGNCGVTALGGLGEG